jgi:glycolate oxidase FAD binding subunit
MRPIDEREFARVLAEAAEAKTPLEVTGGGSKQSIGRPMQTAANLSSKAMRGITLYEPSEMVMAVRAGTPLTQVEVALAERGQMLAFEPMDLGPLTGGEAGQGTIGGAFATNLSGARRVAV